MAYIESVASGVHRLGSPLVSWYLVEHEGRVTAVDAGLPGFRDTLEDDLRSAGHELGDIDAVVLTHSDADHTGLAPPLRDAGARILIHADDDETLRDPGPKSGDASMRHGAVMLAKHPRLLRAMVTMGRQGGARPPKIVGATTHSGDEVLDVPGRPRAVHTPGHTPGHCVLLFEGHGALFVGDAMCTKNLATGSTGPQLMPSGMNVSNAGAEESLALIEKLEAELLLPGHGDPWRGRPADAVAAARAER